MSAFTANTCLFADDWYHRGGKLVAADCSDWSSQPGADLGRYLTNDQPRQALERWFQHYRTFEALPRLRYAHPVFDELGETATAHLEVELPVQAEGQNLAALTTEERWCLTEGRTETWSIRLESVLTGGWKVSRLEVQGAIAVVAFKGSACEGIMR